MINGLSEAFVAIQGWLLDRLIQPPLLAMGLGSYLEMAFDGIEFFLCGVLQIGAAYLLLRPLEALRPIDVWPDRRAVRVDVLYSLLDRLGIIPLLVFALLAPLFASFDSWLRFNDIIPPQLEDLFPSLETRPLLSFLIYLLILDFTEYWRHRLSHRFRWWWALHAIHHSQRQMTLWTDSRNHLLDDLTCRMSMPGFRSDALANCCWSARVTIAGTMHSISRPAASTATAAILRSSFRSGINSLRLSIVDRQCPPVASGMGRCPSLRPKAASGVSNTRDFPHWQRLSARIHADRNRSTEPTTTDSQTPMLDEARAFALTAHGSQMYGDRPYAFHLEAVVSLLSDYGTDAQVVGYLHDVIEDTRVTEDEVLARFGQRVADCVSLLTDSPGASRAERKAGTYARLATVAGPAELALVVKAADRLANVRSCLVDQRRGLLAVYRKEHPSFRRAAYREGLCEPLWRELDALLNGD